MKKKKVRKRVTPRPFGGRIDRRTAYYRKNLADNEDGEEQSDEPENRDENEELDTGDHVATTLDTSPQPSSAFKDISEALNRSSDNSLLTCKAHQVQEFSSKEMNEIPQCQVHKVHQMMTGNNTNMDKLSSRLPHSQDLHQEDEINFRRVPGWKTYPPQRKGVTHKDNIIRKRYCYHGTYNCFEKEPPKSPMDTEPETPPQTPTPVKKLLQEEKEVEDHELAYEFYVPWEPDEHLNDTLKHRRIVDLAHLIEEIRSLQDHQCTIDRRGRLLFKSEWRQGLASVLTYECNCCGEQRKIRTVKEPEKINASAVTAMYSVGKGHDHLQQILMNLQVECLSYETYRQQEEIVGDLWIDCLNDEIEESGRKEREIAEAKGHRQRDGTPYITVIADGGWSHRSYGIRYTAKSGCVVVIGKETKKILFLGVRNKYCSICSIAIKRRKIIPNHCCYKNWDESSSAMEADMVVEAFLKSEEMHGVIYKILIADGDSNVICDIIEKVPYGRDVRKIECVNHLMKNIGKQFYALQQTLKGDELKYFNNKKIRKITAYTRRVAAQFSDHKISREEILRIIQNFGNHCAGDHKLCKKEYCSQSGTEEKVRLNPEFAASLTRILCRLTSEITSLLENETTNLAEAFMHLVAKFTGGKQAFYGRRASFLWRVYGAALLFHFGQQWTGKVWTYMFGDTPPSIMKRVQNSRSQRNISRKRRLDMKKYSDHPDDDSSSSMDSDYARYLEGPSDDEKPRDKGKKARKSKKFYGPSCQKPDLPPQEIEKKKISFLKDLAVTPEEQVEVERGTVGQAANERWHEERKYRITGSKFGDVVMRQKLKGNLVKDFLYPSGKAQFANPIKWGNEHEKIAIAEFEKKEKKTTKECGIFIDLQRGFLGASPDALVVGESALVEAKCPYTYRFRPLSDAENDSSFCLEKVNGEWHLKEDHTYMYQVIGQLAITGRDYCYFIVWTTHLTDGYHMEVIHKDPKRWEGMVPILEHFYMTEMLPEIVDPREARSMPIRNSTEESNLRKQAQAAKEALKRKAEEDDPGETKEKRRKTQGKTDAHTAPAVSPTGEEKQESEPRRKQATSACTDQPEMDQVNQLLLQLLPDNVEEPQENFLLKNANKCLMEKVDGKRVRLWNTCPFDSLVMILSTAMKDYEHYLQRVQEQEENNVTKICYMLLQGQPRTAIYHERAKIMINSSFRIEVEVNRYACQCNISSICAMMESTPSGVRYDVCDNSECCNVKTRSLAFLDLPLEKHNNLQGIKEIILRTCVVGENLLCTKCNQKSRSQFIALDAHLLVVVDGLKRRFLATSQSGSFKVNDLHAELELQEKRYILVGVVEFQSFKAAATDQATFTFDKRKPPPPDGHYVAYVRRANGLWELYDDLRTRVQLNPPLYKEINPHLLVYIQAA